MPLGETAGPSCDFAEIRSTAAEARGSAPCSRIGETNPAQPAVPSDKIG